MTANAFIKTNQHAKQVPLLFVLMSGQKKNDHQKVLKRLIDILPWVPAIQEMTLDLERSQDRFNRQIPHPLMHGCLFHWTQALWRKVS